jgi:hypothetical protein
MIGMALVGGVVGVVGGIVAVLLSAGSKRK